MAVKEILLLGNQELYKISEKVRFEELGAMKAVVVDLHDTIMCFRKQYGVGRAIAAPQIGVRKRLIYMHIGNPVVFINPHFSYKSDEMMELWDDCMSFPNLLVKVRRHKKCTLEYLDENWNKCSLALEDDLSELLQHEYDHLDGILAVSRAIDGKSFAFREQV